MEQETQRTIALRHTPKYWWTLGLPKVNRRHAASGTTRNRLRPSFTGTTSARRAQRKVFKWLKGELAKKIDIKTEVLGPDADKGEVAEVRFLNRVLTWHEEGIDWEADPRHCELIVQQLDLEGCRPVVTPGVKDEPRSSADSEKGSAARRATRTDEPAREQEYNDEDATRHVPKAKSHEISAIMETEGWSYDDCGGYIKSEKGATCLDLPVEGCSGRRIVRDAHTGELIDELNFNQKTSIRKIKKQLKKPMHLVSDI